MKLCSWWLHFVTRLGARVTGNQLEWDDVFARDPLLADR